MSEEAEAAEGTAGEVSPEEGSLDTGGEVVSTPEGEESTAVDSEVEGKEGDNKEESSKEEEGEGKPEELGELYFNGEQVQVEVPDDLSEALSSAGVDVNSIVNELYGKDSDFTLSEETRAPLDEKYGKPVVDTFLGALKTQNETFIKGQQDAVTAAEQANAEAKEWSDGLVGGEEGWDELSRWSEENLDEEQIASFNRAMESGDKWLQELAIKDLQSKYKEKEGDASAALIVGDGSGGSSAGAALSANEYIKEMTSPEFLGLKGQDKVKAQEQLDSRRRAGMKRGL